jgi:hypothetical protein
MAQRKKKIPQVRIVERRGGCSGSSLAGPGLRLAGVSTPKFSESFLFFGSML